MKFLIIINKWANFYFFVQNLSEWHFSNRKEYNLLWRKELGQFSPEEENALMLFKEIRSKYPPARTFFEQAFYTSENPFDELIKHLPAEEYEIIKNIFSSLEKNFGVLFEKDLPFLIKQQEILINKINNPVIVKSIINILSVLYNIAAPEKEIKIYLLLSIPNQRGGGANIDEQSVSVEVSRASLNDINPLLSMIWHEVIHLCFEKKYFLQLVNKKFPDDLDALRLIKEATVCALFPSGVLARKYFPRAKFNYLHVKLPPQYTKSVLELVENYIQKNKAFDDEYINKLYPLISDFKGIIK